MDPLVSRYLFRRSTERDVSGRVKRVEGRKASNKSGQTVDLDIMGELSIVVFLLLGGSRFGVVVCEFGGNGGWEKKAGKGMRTREG